MNAQSSETLVPEAIGVKTIPTDHLVPNPHNPRMLFDREPLEILKESISNVGILVPLTVYWSDSQNEFVILDGQRRWMCAKELNLEEVPVNQIEEPTLVQNIVTMFQIHKLREDWELMPTALKLEVLMRALAESNPKKLAELTGMDRAVVSRCKKLLSYSKSYQDRMLDPDPDMRIRADFFIELHVVRNDRFVNKMEWYSKGAFTKRMLNKYQSKSGGIKAVTDFRVMKQHINNARRANQEREITEKLEEFTKDDTLTLDHLDIKSAGVSATARRLISSLQRIEDDIRMIDVREFYGEETLWRSLERLLRLIRSKLEAADRRIE